MEDEKPNTIDYHLLVLGHPIPKNYRIREGQIQLDQNKSYCHRPAVCYTDQAGEG